MNPNNSHNDTRHKSIYDIFRLIIFTQLKFVITGFILFQLLHTGTRPNVLSMSISWVFEHRLAEAFVFFTFILHFLIYLVLFISQRKKDLKRMFKELILITSFTYVISIVMSVILLGSHLPVDSILSKILLIPSIFVNASLIYPLDYILSAQYELWFPYSIAVVFFLSDILGLLLVRFFLKKIK